MKAILAATSALVLVGGLCAAGPALADPYTLLLAAGGGAGAGAVGAGGPGQTTTSGQDGSGIFAGAGGTEGTGGEGGQFGIFDGGGGGGWAGDGGDGSGPASGMGGSGGPNVNATTPFAGGIAYADGGGSYGAGGFGGGGGGSGFSGGGGGGYSGGGGGGFDGGGGGGGSFIDAAFRNVSLGSNTTGSGFVLIEATSFSNDDALKVLMSDAYQSEIEVLLSDTYFIEAGGGGGGTAFGIAAGAGALVGGDIFLSQGTILDAVLGSNGGDGHTTGGGGGGSFVYTSELPPPQPVPEPGSLGLLSIGLLGLTFVAFRFGPQRRSRG